MWSQIRDQPSGGGLDDKQNVAVELHSLPNSRDGRTTEDGQRAQQSSNSKNDWWLWEIAGVIGSLACIGAILGLLATLDHKPQPTWARHMCIKGYCKTVSVAVNSVISWLSTVAKILVLLPITRGLAQLKWVWFAQEARQLKDMDAFESASRGLTGSVMLLWKLKGRDVATIGALAVVLSLAFDPFIQNLVTYGTELHRNGTQIAYVTNATKYDTGTNFGSASGKTFDVDPSMKANIYASVFATDLSEAWSIPMYTCPSGNCNWDPSASLGICARCADLTAKVKHNCTTDRSSGTTCDAWLPSGLHLNGGEELGGSNNVMTIAESRNTLMVFKNYSWPLLAVQSIAAYDSLELNDSTPYVANECVLNACVRSFRADVGPRNISTGTGESGSLYSETLIEQFDNFTLVEGIGSDLNLTLQPAPQLGIKSRREFSISAITQSAMNLYLQTHMVGLAHIGQSGDGWLYTDALESTSDLMQAIYQNQNLDCSANPKDKVACAMQNIARAMTKTLRDASVLGINKPASGAAFANKGIAQGQVLSPVVFIYVQWAWIILPAVIWLMSCIMLAGTAWKTRRAGVRTWRTSPLALIFLGLDQQAAEKARQHADQHGMTDEALVKKAEDLKVQLHIGENEARLVSA